MVRKLKVLPEIKVTAVEDYLNGKKSIAKISEELSVCTRTVKDWIMVYRSKGALGLFPTTKNTGYSKDLKVKAVEEYLGGNGSLRQISLK